MRDLIVLFNAIASLSRRSLKLDSSSIIQSRYRLEVAQCSVIDESAREEVQMEGSSDVTAKWRMVDGNGSWLAPSFEVDRICLAFRMQENRIRGHC